MKQGRLITDIAFRKEVQSQLEENKRQQPENFLPLCDIVKIDYYAIYVTQLPAKLRECSIRGTRVEVNRYDP